MTINRETHFFLGANGPNGFYSIYDKFISENDRLHIIKAGPGCGKSSFMRIVANAAEERGKAVEYIHCSGDPDSLDGIYIPESHIAYVDGTAPHVIEPKHFGMQSYIDLGSFCDNDAVEENIVPIREITTTYKGIYNQAYKCIYGAAAVVSGIYAPLLTDAVRSAIARRTRGIVSRELKKSSTGLGEITTRFLTAFSCMGYIARFDTVEALARRVYALDNEYGFAHTMLSTIAEKATENGYDIVLCPSPMQPELIEHIIIPELSLAFVSSNSAMKYTGKIARHIRLDALASEEILKQLRPRAKSAQKISKLLLNEAYSSLVEAKRLHDELEQIYNPYMNFDSMRALAAEHCKLFA